MKRRSINTIAALAFAGILTQAPPLHAETSTQGFTANITTTRDGDIYTMDGWTMTDGQSGYFTSYKAGTPIDPTFNIASATGDLSFSDPAFGSFQSTGLIVDYRGTYGAILTFLGNWSPGKLDGDPPAGPASLVISISSNAGTLSASGTMAINSTPEPPSILLMLTALATGGLARHRRWRRRRAKAR